MYRAILFFVCAMVLVSCKTKKEAMGKINFTHTVTKVNNVQVSSPKIIVYRTTKDYSDNVPIILDETKTQIVSYPAPSDVRYNPVPTQLDKGYLLDNRGIGKNVVFTSYTYEEYAALEKTPSKEELLAHIIDKDPISEMWQCGYRHQYGSDIVEVLNKLIKKGFTGCTKIK